MEQRGAIIIGLQDTKVYSKLSFPTAVHKPVFYVIAAIITFYSNCLQRTQRDAFITVRELYPESITSRIDNVTSFGNSAKSGSGETGCCFRYSDIVSAVNLE